MKYLLNFVSSYDFEILISWHLRLKLFELYGIRAEIAQHTLKFLIYPFWTWFCVLSIYRYSFEFDVNNFTDCLICVFFILILFAKIWVYSKLSTLPNPWFGSVHIQHIHISSFLTNYHPDFVPYHNFEVLISFHLNPPNNIYVFSTLILSLIILSKLKFYASSIASLITLTIYPYISVLMINFIPTFPHDSKPMI